MKVLSESDLTEESLLWHLWELLQEKMYSMFFVRRHLENNYFIVYPLPAISSFESLFI